MLRHLGLAYENTLLVIHCNGKSPAGSSCPMGPAHRSSAFYLEEPGGLGVLSSSHETEELAPISVEAAPRQSLARLSAGLAAESARIQAVPPKALAHVSQGKR
jgi:hypothetical protein